MKHVITLLPGDGIGPEITEAAKKVLAATGVEIEWEEMPAGENVMEKYGTPIPDETLESIRKNKVALKGPITTPVGGGFRSVNVHIRKALDLYSCLRPCKSYGIKDVPFPDLDLVVVRENTEDLYAGIEFGKGDPKIQELGKLAGCAFSATTGISIKPISEEASRRIIKFAFDYAVKNGRKKVTGVHKANIMKHSDGIFLEVFREVAAEYPSIESEDRIVDNMTMQLVKKPELYDVMVLPNLYGDILSDLCAGLVGGLGIAPGANIGDDTAVFEPTHGSAPKHAGKNRINPISMILSGALMLNHIGEGEAGKKIEDAVRQLIVEGDTLTYDFGGTSSTSDVGDRLADIIAG
ncbi:MAG: isocitrate dehydrogenase [Elusimicrobia bacterium CG_4_10_14_3_um_filter_49_12_50_7]|nr:MAG: isocitrate dehydrogenase [Elusimicrobia bacterium CG03_land_8_20_14_0_80_50_18]PIY17914.1 MAG: isocitrate dehydrogenase [Elusimicrobia bacterium CG_4_10_14_3_um_filter_49_12_50_7]